MVVSMVTSKGDTVTRDGDGVLRTDGARPVSVRVGCACHRCGGSGVYHTYGACFRCGGNGSDPTGVREWAFPAPFGPDEIEAFYARKAALAAAGRVRSAALRAADEAARFDSNVARFPVLRVAADDEAVRYSSEFVSDVVGKASRYELSERQGAAVSEAIIRFVAERDEAAAAPPAPVSVHVGEVGERLRGVAATVSFTHRVESQFGPSYLVVMEDGDGNVFKTFGSGEFCFAVGAGDEVVFTGTVKAHEDYDGVAQTALSRVVSVK
jgi:hypothetical protein